MNDIPIILIIEPSAPPKNIEEVDVETNQMKIRWRVSY